MAGIKIKNKDQGLGCIWGHSGRVVKPLLRVDEFIPFRGAEETSCTSW